MAKIEIEIDGELVNELSEFFFWEKFRSRPVTPEDEHVPALIVARVDGLSVKMWADEHPPPHFHVSYQEQDASFSILDCARLPGVNGLERYDRIIREWWRKNQKLLIQKWNASRPTNCPVGPIALPSRRT
jgi:hypothetical protein